MILLFLTRFFKDKEFEEKSGSSDTFRFISENFVFHCLFYLSIEQQKKPGKIYYSTFREHRTTARIIQFPSSLTTTSLFEKVYFQAS